ncbi:choline dehydrogenase-like flavoprotein [Saccharopolyspora phatthalungensis]|uniref:Cholesterol oxidase n=1 Tax=Saccharopolyspora phatthalungensis TaxID=664693 RepID=A0A840Q8S8_9PSEU|nr:choline dehydrogenase-like flavoprotein [Saccharopolyspora phatthalungensis]
MASSGSTCCATLATKGGEGPRWKQLWQYVRQHPLRALRMLSVRNWSERTVILLVTQSLDNSLTTRSKRRFGKSLLTSEPGHGAPNPTFIPAGDRANELAAEQIDGIAGGTWGELFGIPLTAHFLGGCPIGENAERGVIDPYHRAYGYPTMSIVDGSAVSANLGVNPSLTITAQAERAFSMWPNKGEKDTRPSQDAGYRQVNPIAPKSPAVPATAPAALKICQPYGHRSRAGAARSR